MCYKYGFIVSWGGKMGGEVSSMKQVFWSIYTLSILLLLGNISNIIHLHSGYHR